MIIDKHQAEFQAAVFRKYPHARVVLISQKQRSWAIPNGRSPKGNKRDKVIARYYINEGYGTLD